MVTAGDKYVDRFISRFRHMLAVKRHVKELKKAIKQHINEELKFQPELWEGLEETQNCFTYALNIRSGEIDKSIIANYGEIVGKSFNGGIVTVDEVYDIAIEMFEKLGIGYKKCSFETEVPEGFFKIAFYCTNKDVHWLRRDDDGTGYHKQGWYKKPTNVDLDGNLIFNPETANIELSNGQYLLNIRYFLISRNYQG